MTFQVGANSGDTLSATFADIEGTTGLGTSGFTGAASSARHGVRPVAGQRDQRSRHGHQQRLHAAATLGAVQNRLQYTSDSISTTEQNLSASNSQIKDVNMASEMTKLTQQQILQQAGTAMLAQANAQPQIVLKLLG